MQLLAKLRQNSRQSMSKMSRELNVPLTTLINKMQKLESYIIKHTSILDFKKLGFDIRRMFFVKVRLPKDLMEFIDTHPTVNTIYSLQNYDYCIEALFSNMKDYYLFMEELEKFGIEKLYSYDIVEQLRFEDFWIDKTNV